MNQIRPIVVALTNHENRSYVGRLGVGLQMFNVTYDTGIHDIWIPEAIGGVDSDDMGLEYNYLAPTFDENPGTPGAIFKENSTVLLHGTRRTDVFGLGSPGHVVVVGPQEFVVYNHVNPTDYYIDLPHDGFVGLRLPTPANHLPPGYGAGANPIWLRMMDQGLLRRNVFSLYLREFNLRGSQGSHIMFGGVDRNAYLGRIRYYGLVEDAYKWIIHMQTVCVAGHEQFWWFKAEIDSGSKYIYGPYEIINAINRQILDREVPLHETALLTNEELAVSDNFREVRFTFGGGDENHVFNLLPQHYICEDEDVPDRYSTVFRPRVFEPEQEPCFTLGLPWLRRYHTTFDFGQRRIGFARSVV